ncbi:hypothetical protein [Streptomyces sp. NPDC090798]
MKTHVPRVLNKPGLRHRTQAAVYVHVRDGRRRARGQPSLSFPWSENEA